MNAPVLMSRRRAWPFAAVCARKRQVTQKLCARQVYFDPGQFRPKKALRFTSYPISLVLASSPGFRVKTPKPCRQRSGAIAGEAARKVQPSASESTIDDKGPSKLLNDWLQLGRSHVKKRSVQVRSLVGPNDRREVQAKLQDRGA